MASFQTNTKNGYYAILNITETYQNISENYTDIYYTLDLYSTSYAFNGWTIGYDIYLDGDQVAYHTNSGNQTSMSKGGQKQVITGSKRFYHNTDGTRSFSIYAKIFTDNVYYLPVLIETSGTAYLTTIPRYANFTEHYIQSVGLNSATVYSSADSSIDYVQYSLNGGVWTDASGLNYGVYNLSPNTEYNIRTRIRRADSGLWTESEYLYFTTKDIARIANLANFEHASSVEIGVTNPSRYK